jgi:hypothetical protein
MSGFLSLFNTPERIIVAPGYWIDIKPSLSAEDYEGAQRALLGKMSMNGGAVSAEPDTVAYQHELVYRSILDWNLTDEDNILLPLTPNKLKHDSIRRLPQSVFLDIYTRVNEASASREDSEQIAFRDGSELSPEGGQGIDEVPESSEVPD